MGNVAAARKLDEAEVGRIFREESGRSVAALIRVFGDIDVAEDAVQDAFAVALRKWTGDGLPPNPGQGSRKILPGGRTGHGATSRPCQTQDQGRPNPLPRTR